MKGNKDVVSFISLNRAYVETVFRTLTLAFNIIPAGDVPGDDTVPHIGPRQQVINAINDAIIVSKERSQDSDNGPDICSYIYQDIYDTLVNKSDSRDSISIAVSILLKKLTSSLRASEHAGLLTLYRNPSLKNWNLYVMVNNLVPEFRK